MIETLGNGPTFVGLGTNADLHRYARWEYGTTDAGWILAGVRRRPSRATRPWTLRLRYWLNSFRGFAAFDVRGNDERA